MLHWGHVIRRPINCRRICIRVRHVWSILSVISSDVLASFLEVETGCSLIHWRALRLEKLSLVPGFKSSYAFVLSDDAYIFYGMVEGIANTFKWLHLHHSDCWRLLSLISAVQTICLPQMILDANKLTVLSRVDVLESLRVSKFATSSSLGWWA